MRYSKQRNLILEAVKYNPVHPTADFVYQYLKSAHPSLSLGTVYRNLNLLSEQGDLLKIEVLGDSDHYDGTISPHYHMHCIKCRGISDIPFEVAPDLAEKVKAHTGMQIVSYDIAFSGICDKCKS